MTQYLIELADGGEHHIEATGVYVDNAGAVRFSHGNLCVFIIAARQWRSVRAADQPPLPAPEPPPKREARILP